MIAALNFIARYIVLIYLLLFFALLFSIRQFTRARRELREAVFGLELEIARRHINLALAGIVSIGLVALAEFILVVFLVPIIPALFSLPTPTGNLIALPANTIPPGITTTENANIPLTAEVVELSGCIPGQIMITSPEQGDQISGKVTLVGTADIPNFGFYKYEISPVGTSSWTTIQGGREVKHEEELGDWETSELLPGDYLLRLVVTDNQGQALPACQITVRVLTQ